MNDLVPHKNPKPTTQERRDMLIQLLQKKGRWRINISQLSKDLGISRDLLQNDLEVIKAHTDVIDADDVKFEIARTYREMSSEAIRILYDQYSTPMLRLKAIETLLKINEQHTRFLEDYGLKDAVQRVNVITHEDFQKEYERIKLEVKR